MKKFCFLSSIFVLIFISCSLNQEQKGSLSITLPEAGTTRSLQEDVVKFQVTVNGPTARTTPFIAPGTVIPIDDLIPGFYTVSVYGYDNNSKKIAQGTNTAAVEGGIKNDVTVEISRAPQDPWEHEPHLPEFELVVQFLGITNGLSTRNYLYDTETPTQSMFNVFLGEERISDFNITPAEGYSHAALGNNKIKITLQGDNFTNCDINVRHKLEAKITTGDETLSFNDEGYVSIGINLCVEGGLPYNGNNTLAVSEATKGKVTCNLKGTNNLSIGSKAFEEGLGNEIKLYKSDFNAAVPGTLYNLEVIINQLALDGYENCFENGSDTKTFKITF